MFWKRSDIGPVIECLMISCPFSQGRDLLDHSCSQEDPQVLFDRRPVSPQLGRHLTGVRQVGICEDSRSGNRSPSDRLELNRRKWESKEP